MSLAETASLVPPPLLPPWTADPAARRWTRDEYYLMGEAGLFEGQRVQLIYGEVLTMSPMRTPHAVALQLTYKSLLRAYGEGFCIRDQLPLYISDVSEPEPDLAVVRGDPRDYLPEHPRTALLAVEVSETTLRFDRVVKRRLYAEAKVVEYWIVNLVDRRLEVFRSAAEGDYTQTAIVTSVEQITPPSAERAILVADLLP